MEDLASNELQRVFVPFVPSCISAICDVMRAVTGGVCASKQDKTVSGKSITK